MILKWYTIKVARGLEKSFAGLMYEAARMIAGLKTPLSDSTTGTQRKLAQFVAILSNGLANVRGTIFVNCFSSLSRASAAAVTVALTSAGSRFKYTSQLLDNLQ